MRCWAPLRGSYIKNIASLFLSAWSENIPQKIIATLTLSFVCASNQWDLLQRKLYWKCSSRHYPPNCVMYTSTCMNEIIYIAAFICNITKISYFQLASTIKWLEGSFSVTASRPASSFWSGIMKGGGLLLQVVWRTSFSFFFFFFGTWCQMAIFTESTVCTLQEHWHVSSFIAWSSLARLFSFSHSVAS